MVITIPDDASPAQKVSGIILKLAHDHSGKRIKVSVDGECCKVAIGNDVAMELPEKLYKYIINVFKVGMGHNPLPYPKAVNGSVEFEIDGKNHKFNCVVGVMDASLFVMKLG
jgi:hypothetical protein